VDEVLKSDTSATLPEEVNEIGELLEEINTLRITDRTDESKLDDIIFKYLAPKVEVDK